MSWKDLLQSEDERVTTPWFGGRAIRSGSRRWAIKGNLPRSFGWYEWKVQGRMAELVGDSSDLPERGIDTQLGYLLGDLFVADSEGGEIKNPRDVMGRFERVRLIEDGLDHFTRVRVDRFWYDGPLVFVQEEFPLGPEDEVRDSFIEKKESVSDVQGVVPALDLVFRMATWHRLQVEAAREEERKRREAEERARALRERMGDGELRRQVAKTDFAAAAKAALGVSGAEYLEHRSSRASGEFVVRYKYGGDRYECVVSEDLRVIDSGICLTDEHTGERGDTYFTLESLPGVIRQAVDENRLVVYRRW